VTNPSATVAAIIENFILFVKRSLDCGKDCDEIVVGYRAFERLFDLETRHLK
jgi:hypothetical protein